MFNNTKKKKQCNAVINKRFFFFLITYQGKNGNILKKTFAIVFKLSLSI